MLLLVPLAAPFLADPWAVLAVAAPAALWLAARPPRREVLVAGAALLVAVLALGARWAQGGTPVVDDPAWRAAVARDYQTLWRELADDARRASGSLPETSRILADPLVAFRALEDLVEEDRSGRASLLLLDPDGQPVAWAGEGLLHELQSTAWPFRGAAFEASFGAVTAFFVAPVGEGPRPWHAVAARSFATDRLPFGPQPEGGAGLRWSLVRDAGQAIRGAVVLPAGDGGAAAPALVVGARPAAGRHAPADGAAARLAWLGLGLALLALAVMRGAGLALAPVEPGRRRAVAAVFAVVLAAGGAAAWGLAAGAPPGALVPLPAAAALALGGCALLARARPRAAGTRASWNPAHRAIVAAAGGVAAVLALAVAAAVALAWLDPLALSPRLLAHPGAFVLRLAIAAAAAGLLAAAAAAGAAPPPEEGSRAEGRHELWAWGAGLALLAGAALCDHPLAALPLLAAGGGAAAAWLRRRSLGRPATAAVLLLLAVLAAAGTWETAHRRLLRRDLVARELPRLAPPAGAELTLLGERVETFFGDSDLGRFVPRSPEGLERQDLAFVLWEGSPLARLDAASALVVRPLEGPPSTFAFGLLLAEDGQPIWDPLSWRGEPPRGEDALTGEAALSYRGRRWARLEWIVVPLPGFDLGRRGRLAEVEAALLRGGPAKTADARLPEGVKLALYQDGRPTDSPWQEAPPLPAALAGEGIRRAVVATPEGAAWAAALPLPAAPPAERRAVLYLPVLSPLAGLERAGTDALGVLLAVLLVTLLALLLALPRAAFRDLLRRTVRSYSKRLLLVYTLLLVVPLLLLNVVLVAAMEDRLRDEQQATGEAALAAAQRMLGSYLASLEPGFDLATSLDDVLLVGLSLVVRHEINLYWGSEIWASTKPELFAARLLPRRIPGESFERIALKGYDLAARTNRVGETSYLELYAPLQVPGEEVGPRNFFLSMPLLAQQEEVARELGALRRQALLITAALVVLVTAAGVRLSRGFTRPLTELVAGTRRIARGARSLDLAPTELELAALVEAVDDMARRIAEARERLVREKQVVEGVVEHINSGVVSVDHRGRVLLRNRVAAELLGVGVDEPLAAALGRDPRLEPVADWLAGAAEGRGLQPAQRTLRLPAAGESESGDGEGGEREWSLVWVPVPGPGDPAALLVVEDVTETLRGQRLEAWAEMARIIAHEIKNPLTPIRLNVEHMQQVWRDGMRRREAAGGESLDGDRFDEIFARCTRNVLVQVDELRQIAAEFSTYSRIPRIERQPGDLVAAMRELVEPYRAAPPAGVTVELETAEDHLPARFDRRLLARAVRNLLENALRASAGGGRVTLRLERRPGAGEGGDGPVGAGGGAGADGHAGGEARIAVLDAGPGIDPALLPRIFDPYFSTHDTGTGLGLPIARRIVEEHGGSIAARNRPEGGLEVAIVLPAEGDGAVGGAPAAPAPPQR